MNNNKDKKILFFGTVGIVIVIAVVIISLATKIVAPKDQSLESLLKKVNVKQAEPKKASITLSNAALYDELPDINKYPLAVEGNADLNIEIFTSGEKGGAGSDSWLVTCAQNFNKMDFRTTDGKSVNLSVRSISSGLGADYIISRKYLPDLYTPSNELFGEYAKVNGGVLTLQTERLVGNTAGILIKKDSTLNSVDDIINSVTNGTLNLGYTNPQTSATGLNLLIYILTNNGGIDSEKASAYFSSFNNNIPFVAYTTQQMRDSASNGSLDGMVTEYQAYINDTNLTSQYNFLPFGMRHDNPLYVVDAANKSAGESEAIQLISDYLLSDEAQSIADSCGFNENDSYQYDMNVTGIDINKSLEVYKSKKDSGKDIIAVFVADCSGSMNGEPILELKSSLSNGMNYINENNYVGLVSYATDVTVEVPIAKFDMTQKSYFQGALNSLVANGNTSSYEAVCVGLDMILNAKKDHPDAKPMIFLLSDGYQNVGYDLGTVTPALRESEIPVYTISYTSEADTEAMRKLSEVNEAATINADSDDIVYKIKSLFNSQM